MIDPELVKTHLRVDHDDEDALLTAYTAAAVSAFEIWTNRTLIAADAQLPDPVGSALRITPAVQQGALLLIGSWYANREAVVTGTIASEMPLATRALWSPFRWVNL